MARTYFQLRTGTLDIKTERQYKYQDTRCRLCENGEEDIIHIVNKCCKMPHHSTVLDIHSTNIEDIQLITSSIILFINKVEEIEQQES